MLNLSLMRHWENWLIVLFVVWLAFIAVNSLSKIVIKKTEGN